MNQKIRSREVVFNHYVFELNFEPPLKFNRLIEQFFPLNAHNYYAQITNLLSLYDSLLTEQGGGAFK